MNDEEKKRIESLEQSEKKLKDRYKYQNDYIKNNYDKIILTFPKGQKAEIEKHMSEKGYRKLTDYIKALIEYDMNANKTPAAAMPETIPEITPKNSYNTALYDFDDTEDYIPPKKPIEYDYTLEEQLNKIKQEHNI